MKRSFTLIEIVISLVILTTGLLGMLALFPVGLDATKRAGINTNATLLAQTTIEDLKRRSYSDNLDADGTFSTPFDYYDYAVDETALTGFKEVKVQIWWPAADGSQGNRGSQKNIELITYIAKYEP